MFIKKGCIFATLLFAVMLYTSSGLCEAANDNNKENDIEFKSPLNGQCPTGAWECRPGVLRAKEKYKADLKKKKEEDRKRHPIGW